MTEQELLRRLSQILAGEKQALQRELQRLHQQHQLGPKTIASTTYRIRHYLTAIDPEADSLVNQWVDEVLHGLSDTNGN